jgi:membrane protease subunit HflC
MKATQLAWLMLCLALALLAGESLFVVGEGEQVLRTRFGAAQGEVLAPGLHASWPFEHLLRFDARTSTQQLQGEPFLGGEQQALLVDLALSWRVQDAMLFYSTVGADEQRASGQLADALRSELKAAYAGRSLAAIVAAPNGGVDAPMLARLAERAKALGLRLLDAQVTRIDPTDEAAAAIARRMQSGYEADARKVRAQAEAEVQRIQADGERQRAQLLGDANREAQRLRGEGDAQAAAVYARAYGRNPEFAAFYRSLEAYRTALGREGDVLVIQPDGDFYKYLRSPARR